jgi:(p)ppGpp synthase/HD superfamily hydrolase
MNERENKEDKLLNTHFAAGSMSICKIITAACCKKSSGEDVLGIAVNATKQIIKIFDLDSDQVENIGNDLLVEAHKNKDKKE